MKKLETTSTVLLKHHLKALKLPTMTAECEKAAARCARENVDHLGFLLQLCELELIERERRSAERRLKAARFPTVKTLESYDFAAAPTLNQPLVLELARCDFVERRENLLLVGGPGTRRFIKVLRLLEHASLRELTRAVEAALELGTADADAVRLILEHRRERPAGLFCLDGRPHLKLVGVPAPDLSAYASLTAGVAP